MELKSFHAVIEAEVEFTRDELRQLAEFSFEHYDLKCRAAANEGGFLYGFRQQLELTHISPVAVQVTWQQLDLLAKIAEGETGFRTNLGRPILGELGSKLHNIMDQMRNYSQAVNRGTR